MIGEALRLLRVFGDLKGKDLAIKLGISPNYLSEIEKGKKRPSLQVIDKYGETFNIKPSTILSLAEDLSKISDRIAIAEKLIVYLKIHKDNI